MGTYRKIDVRLWGDAKFNALSKAEPNAQTLWIYLLTGPHTSGFPGLSSTGKAALAERLRWDYVKFEECFQELLDSNLIKYDSDNFIIWIPNSIKYHSPESPNVIKYWKKCFEELPESSLKDEAIQEVKAFLEAFSKALAKAFEEAFKEALPKAFEGQDKKPFRRPPQSLHESLTRSLPVRLRQSLPVYSNSNSNKSIKNTKESDVVDSKVSSNIDANSLSPLQKIFKKFEEGYLKKTNKIPLLSDEKVFRRAEELLESYGVDQTIEIIDKFFDEDDDFVKKAGYSFNVFYSQAERLLTKENEKDDQQRMLKILNSM